MVGLEMLSPAMTSVLENAKREAAKFAPIMQGYVLSDTPLGKAKALEKFGKENPIIRRRVNNKPFQLSFFYLVLLPYFLLLLHFFALFHLVPHSIE